MSKAKQDVRCHRLVTTLSRENRYPPPGEDKLVICQDNHQHFDLLRSLSQKKGGALSDFPFVRLSRRPLAEADVLQIWDHIADDSLTAADHWVDRLDEEFRLLATGARQGSCRLGHAANV